MASLVKRYLTYYAIFSNGVRKKWIRIGKVSKPDAKRILKRLVLENTIESLFIEKKRIDLKSFIDKYLEHSRINKAPVTYKGELRSLNNLLKFTGNIDISNVTAETIENYKAMRVGQGLKPNSTNRELAYIRAMLYRAKDYGYLDTVPKFRLLKIQKLPPKALSEKEVDLLLNNASLYLKPMLVVMLNTGVRSQELLGLRFSDIDYKFNLLKVTSPKTRDYRYLPMNATLVKTLMYLEKNYISPSSYRVTRRKPSHSKFIFCDYKGDKIESIKACFKNLCTKAGVNASPHSLRHTFASNLLSRGVDIVTLKELLGHKSIETTLMYAHSNNKLKVEAVNKIG